MPNIIEITDFSASELDVYARLTEAQLLNRFEPAKGMFIAESPKVIHRALDGGCKPVSLLMERKDIDGFTPEQRFYLSYANVWAANIRDEEILSRTKTDPHSLGRWRVNATLRNLQPFFDAFNVKEGDKMFRSVNDRVVIW